MEEGQRGTHTVFTALAGEQLYAPEDARVTRPKGARGSVVLGTVDHAWRQPRTSSSCSQLQGQGVVGGWQRTAKERSRGECVRGINGFTAAPSPVADPRNRVAVHSAHVVLALQGGRGRRMDGPRLPPHAAACVGGEEEGHSPGTTAIP